MLQNAYFLAKIGADTAENEQHFAEILPTDALDGVVGGRGDHPADLLVVVLGLLVVGEADRDLGLSGGSAKIKSLSAA